MADKEFTADKELKLNSQYTVAMGNELVKIQSELSVNELKVLRTVISNCQRDDEGFYRYETTVPELAEFFGINAQDLYNKIPNDKKSKSRIDKITKDLTKEVVYLIDASGEVYDYYPWFQHCRYNTKTGKAEFELNSRLADHLLNLKELYTSYVLENILVLKSAHSIRLYELLTEAVKTKKVKYPYKVYLSVDEIRTATGTQDKYVKLNMWQRRVIDSSIEELNEKLFYDIKYYPVRKGNKFIGYDFWINRFSGADKSN